MEGNERKGIEAREEIMDTLKLVTLTRFCSDYHSGQWSRGYRLLCACLRKCQRIGIPRPLDTSVISREFYQYLTNEYTDRM